MAMLLTACLYWRLYANPMAQLRRKFRPVEQEAEQLVTEEQPEQIWYTLVVRNSRLNSLFLFMTVLSRVALALASIESLSWQVRSLLIGLRQAFAAVSVCIGLSNLVGMSSFPSIYQETLKSSFVGSIYLVVAGLNLVGLFTNL
ncbi:hypothetical protein Ciccas_013528 [Cichlidogyrus casuarinus]|uniref:Solute carrier family 40 protein n=1 Tax=Cichlidogyrus casuarinus TaxID=1844966 RepID=A0ABD2PMN9_9PLAT